MSIARKDDRHKEDLVNEISEGFNRALAGKREPGADAEKPPVPQFRVTGDSRTEQAPRKRRDR